jgi:hypothetical protein
MKIYVGNCGSHFNCNDLIAEIKQHDVPTFHGHMDLDSSNPFYQDSVDQTNMLRNAGYNDHTVEYRHYQSGIHFNSKYQDLLGDITNCTPLMCWVSEIHPGKCTPWHWDINPWENEHKKLGKIVRFFMFVTPPAPGHIFVTNDDAYYNEEQGAIYKYADIHSWHAGTNIGLVPKMLLTLTGYQ